MSWAREWLEGVRELGRAARHDEAVLEAMLSRAGSPRTGSGGVGARGGDVSDPTASEAMAISAARSRAERSLSAWSADVRELDGMLASMDDANPRHPWWSRAIRTRYVDDVPDVVGAATMGYGVSQYRLFVRCGIDWLEYMGPRGHQTQPDGVSHDKWATTPESNG